MPLLDGYTSEYFNSPESQIHLHRMNNFWEHLSHTHLPHYAEMSQRNTEQDWRANLQGLHDSGNFLIQAGRELHNPGLENTARLGMAGINLYTAYAGWTSMAAAATTSTAATAATALGPTAFLSPMTLALSAALTIFSIARSNHDEDGVNPFSMMIQQMHTYTTHICNRIESFRQENFAMQLVILKTIKSGFGELTQSLNNNTRVLQSFYSDSMARFHDLQNRLNQIESRVAFGQRFISLEEFKTLVNEIKDVFEKRETRKEKIKEIANRTAHWIKTEEKGEPALIATPMYTGVDFLLGVTTEDERMLRIIEGVFPDVNAETVMTRRGFLAYYAEKVLNIPTVVAGKTISFSQIVDPQLYEALVSYYIPYRRKVFDCIDDPNEINIDGISRTASLSRDQIKFWQRSELLFTTLFDKFTEALEEINKIYKNEFKKQNEHIGNVIDIEQETAVSLAKFNGEYPKNQLIHGLAHTTYKYGQVNDMPGFVAHPGTSADCHYRAKIKDHYFPHGYIGLEALKAGSFYMTVCDVYTSPTEQEDKIYVMYGSPPKYCTRTFDVKFTYSDTGATQHVLTITQATQHKDITNAPIDQTINIINSTDGEKKYKEEVLKHRITAIQNSLPLLKKALKKLDAYRRLILAYAIDIGFKQEEITLLEKLLSEKEIVQRLLKYINDKSANAYLPYINQGFASIKITILGKLRGADVSYFQCPLVNRLSTTITQLSKLKEEEKKLKELQALYNQEQKREAEKQDEVLLQSMIQAYQENMEIWTDPCYLDRIPKQRRQGNIYQNLIRYVALAKNIIETVDQLQRQNALNIKEMVTKLSQLNPACKEIHKDLRYVLGTVYPFGESDFEFLRSHADVITALSRKYNVPPLSSMPNASFQANGNLAFQTQLRPTASSGMNSQDEKKEHKDTGAQNAGAGTRNNTANPNTAREEKTSNASGFFFSSPFENMMNAARTQSGNSNAAAATSSSSTPGANGA